MAATNGKFRKFLKVVGIGLIFIVGYNFLRNVNVEGTISNALVRSIGQIITNLGAPTQKPGVPMTAPGQPTGATGVNQDPNSPGAAPGQPVVEYMQIEEVGYIKTIITRTRLAELKKDEAEGGKYGTLWKMDRGSHVEVPILGRCYKVKPGQTVNGAVAAALGIPTDQVRKDMYEDALVRAGNGKKIAIQPGFIFVVGQHYKNVEYKIHKIVRPRSLTTPDQVKMVQALQAGLPITQDSGGTRLIFYKIATTDTTMEAVFKKVSGETLERQDIRRALTAAGQANYIVTPGDVIVFKLVPKIVRPEAPAGKEPAGPNPELNPEDLLKLL